MIVEYVGKEWYSYIIVLVILILAVLVAFIGGTIYKVYINKKRYDGAIKKIGRKKYKKIVARNIRWLHCFIAATIFVCWITGELWVLKDKYAVSKELSWIGEEKKEKNGLYFPALEREILDKKQWCEEALHIEWYNANEGEYIDEKMLKWYKGKVYNIFLIIPEKSDRNVKEGELDSGFVEKKENFERLVNSSHKELESKELWKGYEDGVEVCKVYNNSENVFQTGVLAESARENADKTQESPESCLLYTAGMVKQFETFLEFDSRDIGEGVTVSDVEVCFRMEKGLYWVSKRTSDYDEKTVKHCGLFGYWCSQYTVEKTNVNDKNYLVYLDNSGLNCLNLMPYIKDKKLVAELCQKELERWKALEGRDMSVYKNEGKSLDEIMRTKKRLEDYIDFMNGEI